MGLSPEGRSPSGGQNQLLRTIKVYFVYAIKSTINSDLYIGYTDSIDKRVKRHNDGFVKSTKFGKPWELVYYEFYKSKKDATKRERQLKQSYFKKELKERIIHSLEDASE